MSKGNFTIKPVTLDDVPLIAKMSAAAFENDRQTIMKGLGSAPFSMEEHTLESLPVNLNNPKLIILKAVENDTQELMGYINWGFRGFSPEEMPVVEGRVQTPQKPAPAPKPQPPAEELDPEAEKAKKEAEEERKNSPVQRLIALQDADMKAWMDEVMPEGTRCIFVVGLQVEPKHQGHGVASALLRFGTKFCDDKGVFAWVHSSESAWKAYEKCGFQVIRSLDCDLDEYSPMPPPGEGPDAKWGHYVLRYMKYFPKNDK